METKTSLVWSDSRVKLHSIAKIYMVYTLIICPGYSECDDSLRLYKSLKESILSVYLFVLLNYRIQRIKNSLGSLKKLRLIWMFSL